MSHSRYYVIGNSVQVMGTNWLSSFPMHSKEVTDEHIFLSLKPKENGKPFLVFTDLDHAKKAAIIKANNDNDTSSQISAFDRPVLEISLINSDSFQLTPKSVDITDGSSALKAEGFETYSNNIKDVYTYYYRAGAKEITVALNRAFDLQNKITTQSPSNFSLCKLL